MACVERVAELDGADDLEEKAAGSGLVEPGRVALELVEDRVVHVFEHEVQPPLAPEHLKQVDEVFVSQLLHHTRKYWTGPSSVPHLPGFGGHVGMQKK